MKITNQTADEMSLKQGNAAPLTIGILLVLGGVALGYHFESTPGMTSSLWIAIVVAVIGLLVFFLSPSITVVINKPNNQISYQKKEMIGAKQATYAISDVSRIETRKQWETRSTGTGNNRTMQQVLVSQSVIVFKDGSELALDSQNGGGQQVSIGPAVMMAGSSKETALATQVATFMGVPFQEIAPPNAGMGAGINIGGIQL